MYVPSQLETTLYWNVVSHWLHGCIYEMSMRLANERRRYIVTSSRIGWAHIQNHPWKPQPNKTQQSHVDVWIFYGIYAVFMCDIHARLWNNCIRCMPNIFIFMQETECYVRFIHWAGDTCSDKIATYSHDDVIKWKHFPRYWPFVRGIHRSPVNSPHKGQWRGALMFSLMCA